MTSSCVLFETAQTQRGGDMIFSLPRLQFEEVAPQMVPLSKLVSDEWYISIACVCGERLVLFQDLTRGKGTLQGSFEITCPACGKRESIPRCTISIIQAQ